LDKEEEECIKNEIKERKKYTTESKKKVLKELIKEEKRFI
jgi:hypothetical protein